MMKRNTLRVATAAAASGFVALIVTAPYVAGVLLFVFGFAAAFFGACAYCDRHGIGPQP